MRSYDGAWPAAILLSIWLCAATPGLQGGAAAAELKRGENRRMSAVDLQGLEVRNNAGYLEVRGEEREDIELEIQYRVRSRKADHARQALDLIKLEARREGEWLLLIPRYGEEDLSGRVPDFPGKVSLRIDILARVPEALALRASVSSGDLKIMGLARDVRITATSGDVEAYDLGGDFRINLTSGDLLLEELGGRLEVSATSGDLSLRRLAGDARIQCISGDISVEAAQGGLNIDNITGDIDIRGVAGPVKVTCNSGCVFVKDPQGTLRVNTSNSDITVVGAGYARQSLDLASSSGDIEIFLRAEASFRIDLNTTLGGMRCRLPLEIEDISRRHLAGIIGDGDSAEPLRVVTASGDIRIKFMED